MADLKAFAEQLVNLTVKEVSELATILKEEYGIEPAAAAVAVAGPAAAGAAADCRSARRRLFLRLPAVLRAGARPMRAGIRRALLAVPGVGVGVRRARLLGAFPLLAGVWQHRAQGRGLHA